MSAHRPVIMAQRHAIAAGHYLAAQAGFEILNAGGNAIDAGVAAGLAIGVLQSEFVNFAGIAPIMIRLAGTREVLSIDGVGVWPRAMTPDLFWREHGQKIPEGILRTVVPGAPASWLMALSRYGTMSFGEVAAAAIRFARDGFPMYPQMAYNLGEMATSLRRWPSSRAVYLPDDRVPEVGELFRQTDLARSLQYMVDEETAHAGKGRAAGLQAARDAFYRGDLARVITNYHRANGGLLTLEDMADFEVRQEPTIRVIHAGLEVHCCGPWSQGPAVAQTLKLLAGFDLAGLGHNSTAYIHTVAEAMKLAFADRDRYCADPAFLDVPLDAMLSPGYIEQRRAMIRPDRAWPEMPPAGDLGIRGAAAQARELERSMAPQPPGHDTSSVAVIDRHGNMMVTTPSDVPRDTPVIPGTGFCPSSRGSQSWADPDHASSIAPGKRPRLSSNPMLALRGGEPAMVWATPGADIQPQATLQVLLNVTVFGMDIQSALEAPRFATYSFPQSFEPHDYYPGRLNLESRIAKETGAALAALGHKVEWWSPELVWRAGGVNAVWVDPKHGLLHAGSDHRRPGYALGW